jgi:hypothetical protein
LADERIPSETVGGCQGATAAAAAAIVRLRIYSSQACSRANDSAAVFEMRKKNHSSKRVGDNPTLRNDNDNDDAGDASSAADGYK